MRRFAAMVVSILCACPAFAQDRGPGKAGEFDYYLLSLSWSPTWCTLTGEARGDPQCEPGRRLGFVVHGLWPQLEEGYPTNCRTAERDPSRRETAAMADIMGGAGLAYYQWQKHGRCSGLSAEDYFATLRRAREAVVMPPVLSMLDHDLRIDPQVIEDAFLEVNPGLSDAGMTVTCKSGRIQEVRICLTRDLAPRDCAPDVARDCATPDTLLEAPG